MLKIDGILFKSGTKTELNFNPYGMQYDIPTTVICGEQPGRTVLITAQIHAGEYNGSVAAMRAAKALNPTMLKGNVIIMHCVNTTGFFQRYRRFVPEDRVDLNGNYPGNPNGSVGHKIAAWFVEKVFPHIDFVLDLHGGQDKHLLESCVFYPSCPNVVEASLAAAKAMNPKYLIASCNAKGEYGYAAHKMDIPALLVECGYGCVVKEEWAQEQLDNILRLLKHLEVFEIGAVPPVKNKIVFKKAAYLIADCKGVWNPKVVINQKVTKGQLLATVTDFFGKEVKSYYAVGDGIVVYYIAGMLVMDGDEAIAYGLLEDAEIM